MNCDYLIQPNKKLKDASHTLELVKFDWKEKILYLIINFIIKNIF
jgi:hypothetical protein